MTKMSVFIRGIERIPISGLKKFRNEFGMEELPVEVEGFVRVRLKGRNQKEKKKKYRG